MFFEGLTSRGSTAALTAMMAFTEARHRMIAENVANAHTVNYRAKQLDVREFQRALGEAIDRGRESAAARFEIRDTDQVEQLPGGRLRVTPSIRQPLENLLFHDGTNLSIERQMADLADNALVHELSAVLLKDRFDGLRKAIRGQA